MATEMKKDTEGTALHQLLQLSINIVVASYQPLDEKMWEDVADGHAIRS